MPQTKLDEMDKVRKELKLLRQLYGLYENVDATVEGYNDILWVDVLANIDTMTSQVNEKRATGAGRGGGANRRARGQRGGPRRHLMGRCSGEYRHNDLSGERVPAAVQEYAQGAVAVCTDACGAL